LIGIYHRSNLLTWLSIALAAAGIWLAFARSLSHGMACLVACGVCDLLDGPYARRFKRDERQSWYGVELDSLADALAFGALPMSLYFASGGGGTLGLAVSVAYMLAAINRLAFFNTEAAEAAKGAKARPGEPVQAYRGLPVTYAALAYPLAWQACQTWLPAYVGAALGCLSAVLALLFVLDIKVAKPRGLAIAMLCLAAIAVTAWILLS
jgi:CDP-diacylglycerol--serine O-phosphatidyltransferase